MAVGELVGNVSGVPELRTQKLKLMVDNQRELAAFWPLEVQHQLKYAASESSRTA